MDNTKQTTNLINFVKANIVTKITDDPKLIKHATTGNSVGLWVQCFSSPLISDVNYEPVETFGDSICDVCFFRRVRREFMDITPKELSSMRAYYVDNRMHANLINKLNKKVKSGKRFQDYINTGDILGDEELPYSIVGDLYEAIFGTIADVFDNYTDGLGIPMAIKWYNHIIDVTELNLDRNIEDPIAKLEQIFTRLSTDNDKVAKPNFSTERSRVGITNDEIIGGKWVLSDKLLKRLMAINNRLDDDLKIENIREIKPNTELLVKEYDVYEFYPDIKDPKKGYVYADTKKEAKYNSAKYALEYLDKYGINKEWSINVKKSLGLDDDLINDLYSRLDKDGYIDYTINKDTKYSKTGSYTILKLYGIDDEENMHLLLSIKGYNSVVDIKKQLIQKYIDTRSVASKPSAKSLGKSSTKSRKTM